MKRSLLLLLTASALVVGVGTPRPAAADNTPAAPATNSALPPGVADPSQFGLSRRPKALSLKSGAVAELYGKTHTVAWGLFIFFLLIGVVSELFGSVPGHHQGLGHVISRAIVVMLLLITYPTLFGSVAKMTDELAEYLCPPGSWVDYSKTVQQTLKEQFDALSLQDKQGAQRKAQAEAAAGGSTPTTVTTAPADDSTLTRVMNAASARLEAGFNLLGGWYFNFFISAIVFIALAADYVMALFGAILAALFYVLGPIALVASIPRGSGAGARWFTQYVTFCAWPVFSGIILKLVLSLGKEAWGSADSGALGALVVAMVLMATSLSTPMLASALVGGSLRNVSSGWDSALTGAFSPVTTAAGAMFSAKEAHERRLANEERQAQQGQGDKSQASEGRGGQPSSSGRMVANTPGPVVAAVAAAFAGADAQESKRGGDAAVRAAGLQLEGGVAPAGPVGSYPGPNEDRSPKVAEAGPVFMSYGASEPETLSEAGPMAMGMDQGRVSGVVQLQASASAQNGTVQSLALVSPPPGVAADQLADPEQFLASWDTTQVPEGPITLHFLAIDSFGAPADRYVTVVVDNVPFAQVQVSLSAGAPVSGATVQVLALNDADGGLDTSLDGGPVLGVSASPTDAHGQTVVTLTQENYLHRPVMVVASGSGLSYVDPSDGAIPISVPGSFAFTSTLADFSSSQAQTAVPVTLWTTLCDAAAKPYLAGKNPLNPHPVPLHQALSLAEDAFARHVTTRVPWSVRTAVPASLTSGGPKTLTDEVYAALPDLALNQLARDWSYQAALTPGGVITAPAVVAALAGQDLYADDLFDGLGAGGARLFAPGSTPIPYDANTTRSVLALELDRFLKAPTNLSGLARADLVSAGVMDAMALDQSVFYPSALVAPPNPWSSLDADGPVITWGSLSPGQGVRGVVPVTAQAADQSLIQSFSFTGALRPQGAQLTSRTNPDGGEVDTLSGSLDVSALQDGPITLSAEAVDEHGNRSDSSINLFVSNHGPDLSILSPSAGTAVSGTVQVRAQATARNGSVQSLVLVGTVAGMGPNTATSGDAFTTSWDTTQALEGPVTLQFLATDTYGATAEASVQVTVDNVPFGKVTVSLFAGVPVSGATIKVYAVSDADGGYDDRGGQGALLGQGGPTAGSNDPQVAPGTAVVTLDQENYRGPIQVVVDGTGVTYPDPSDSSTTISVPGTFRFTSYVADYRTGDAISAPVSLWTTVADAAAAAYVRGSQKAAGGPRGPQSLSAAMAVTDPLMSSHVSDGHTSWALRTTLPVPLTDGSQQTLRDAVFASLADVALNRLARDISTNSGISPGSVITAVSLAQQLAADVGSDGCSMAWPAPPSWGSAATRPTCSRARPPA